MTLKIQNLRFKYPSQKDDLLKIDHFEMKSGEKVFLFGPSGSGKSSFLELVAGIQKANSGQVAVCGQDLNPMTEAQRDAHRARHLGFIFQSFNLLPFLTVTENILLGSSFSRERKARSSDADVQHLLQMLGLQTLAYRRAGELSVGQAQRVAAARALLGKPELLLADEPTSALDHDHREAFLKLLFELAQENRQSILFVSHDRSLAPMFDRSVSLYELGAKR
jgi:putative ABC transport system ATP-binding protein